MAQTNMLLGSRPAFAYKFGEEFRASSTGTGTGSDWDSQSSDDDAVDALPTPMTPFDLTRKEESACFYQGHNAPFNTVERNAWSGYAEAGQNNFPRMDASYEYTPAGAHYASQQDAYAFQQQGNACNAGQQWGYTMPQCEQSRMGDCSQMMVPGQGVMPVPYAMPSMGGMQMQWVAVPMPVSLPITAKPMQQQMPGFEMIRREKPMLEDLLPGKTRGSRRRRVTRSERPDGSPAPSKVFVGGLSPASTAETLREHFEKFGVVADCAVVSELGTKKSRGFGFVEFADGIPAGLFAQEHIVGQRRCGVRPYDYQSEVDEVTNTVM